MVDAQTVGVLVTATSVTVAAIYYMITLRETTRNRKVALTRDLLQAFYSEEGLRRTISLLNMEWTDLEDFRSKYDSKVNVENWVERAYFLTSVNYIGYLVKEGLIDLGSIYEVGGEAIMDLWMKLKPIFYHNVQAGDYGRDFIENVEHVANEMARMKVARDPSYKGSRDYFKPREYERVFGK